MDNIQPPQNATPPSSSSDVPNLPAGTYEYIDVNKKKNWKKIFEISLLGLIAGIPLLLSFFQFDYSVKRVYEVVNPAYVGTTSSYDGWSGIITAAKNIIHSSTPTEKKESNDGAIPSAQSFETLTPSPTPQPAEEQTQNAPTTAPESQEFSTQPDKQNDFEQVNQENEGDQSPESDSSPSVYPSSGEESSGSEQAIITAESSCSGKKKGTTCSYQLSNGYIFYGRCKPTYGGSLMCSAY